MGPVLTVTAHRSIELQAIGDLGFGTDLVGEFANIVAKNFHVGGDAAHGEFKGHAPAVVFFSSLGW